MKAMSRHRLKSQEGSRKEALNDGGLVDANRARLAADRIFEQSLGLLTRSGGLSILPGSWTEGWRVSDQGKLALSSYGLPPARRDGLMGVAADFQESGELESGADGVRFYALGRYGSAKLVAVEDDGCILAVPERSEVHPGLKSRCPLGIPAISVNASIDLFVECAWRWYWIVPLLADEQKRVGEAEISAWRKGGIDGIPDPYVEYQELCGYILKKYQVIDSTIQGDSDFWSDVIVDLW
ncbi:SUKH-4 family immunity protein [Streptomyces sp. NPDC057137]|uniref:SUKH-4 family immunity protein n=1 Tax=Streptomyces sp. NPDC057137 TaxID=3346030 RepID=UPI00363CA472